MRQRWGINLKRGGCESFKKGGGLAFCANPQEATPAESQTLPRGLLRTHPHRLPTKTLTVLAGLKT